MNIIIYNINSFGGNYEYSKYLFKAYSKNKDVQSSMLLMPVNADVEGTNILKLLLPDMISYGNKWIRKMHFLYRSI